MTSSTQTARKTASSSLLPAIPLATDRSASVAGLQILSGLDWLTDVQELHTRVRAEMPESQRHWLLPKPTSYFEELLTGKTGVLLGLMDEGRLAGFMALLWADNFALAHAEGRLTCPDPHGSLAKIFAVGRVIVAQSMCISNAYLGRGFSRAIIQGAVSWVEQQGYVHFFAQIADHNILSWLRFLQQDFAIVTTWVSGHRRFLLRRLLPAEKTKQLKQAKAADRHSYAKDYAQVPALLAELVSRLEQGRIAFLDTRDSEPAGLSFVFGKPKF